MSGRMSNDETRRTRQILRTRSHSWREVGLARQLSRRAVKRARIEAFVLMPLLVVSVAILGLLWQHMRHGLIGNDGAPAGGKSSSAGAASADASKKK